ncbi:osmotically-inducible protein OsmY [Pararhizobium capsulatum DSM 1112]|uniref:Osmotically-inducible protein OsmY n=1 Tax=Pararhizobium capsulatum DSM 1112 TaxID=1121113 RepID=A0ABU0BU46_9HYPH|nr:hypothetical protein [Pararhizobium capsulatum]MDQ0321186.1 osmotically-inducible protein OsmY [Pararhizobium capsulatum DSM 1112]
MQTLTFEQIDGRLNAHRRLFVALVAYIARDAKGREFLEELVRDTEIVSDHEEDPGIEPDEGFAGQQIGDEEIQSIVRAALSRADAVEGFASKGAGRVAAAFKDGG